MKSTYEIYNEIYVRMITKIYLVS